MTGSIKSSNYSWDRRNGCSHESPKPKCALQVSGTFFVAKLSQLLWLFVIVLTTTFNACMHALLLPFYAQETKLRDKKYKFHKLEVLRKSARNF